jgi:hypothetical protein
MSRQSELAELSRVYSETALSNRNLIINGAMQVWQRGTSHSTSGYGSVDRWQQLNNTLLSRSTDVPTDEGFQYSSKVDFAGGADSNFVQNIENGIGLTSGKSVTLSFWAKATGSITRFENIFFINNTNFGVITSPAVAITNSWQRHTLTVTIPSYPAAQYSDVLQIRFDLDPLESGSYYITGVQLELGDTATPFEHRSYDQEHLLCQRYFQRFGGGVTNGRMGVGAWNNSTSADIAVHLTHEMRAIPTVTAVQGGRLLDYAVAWHDVTSLVGSTESTRKLLNLNLQNTSQPSAASQGDSAALGGGGAPFDYWADAEI